MLYIEATLYEGKKMRLSVQRTKSKAGFGFSALLLEQMDPYMELLEFVEETRRLRFRFGRSGHKLTNSENHLLMSRELRITFAGSAEGINLSHISQPVTSLEAFEVSQGVWEIEIPEHWVVPKTDNLFKNKDLSGAPVNVEHEPEFASPTIDVTSGKLRIPPALCEALVRDLGAGKSVRVQYAVRGDVLIMSPRVWKGKADHTAFTTGHNPRPRVSEHLEDGDYEYTTCYSNAESWFVEIRRSSKLAKAC